MLITFEGIDGGGKTTQIGLLRERLEAEGNKVHLTKEPGGTELGLRLRGEILNGGDIFDRTELLLYLADRAEHIAKVVKPALERGEVVISDRFFDSTIAYQVGGRGFPEDKVWLMNEFATDGLKPDLTVILDLTPEQSQERIAKTRQNKDRLESSGLEFFTRTRNKFLELASASPLEDGGRFIVIDAMKTVDEIAAEVWKAVRVAWERLSDSASSAGSTAGSVGKMYGSGTGV